MPTRSTTVMRSFTQPSNDPIESVVRRLLSTAIRDLSAGKPAKDVGWVNLTDEELAKVSRGLSTSRSLETRPDHQARIVIASHSQCTELKAVFGKLDRQIEHLFDSARDTPKDLQKKVMAATLLAKVTSHLSKTPADWASVVLLGWSRMIESTSIEVPLSQVLQAGLSPKAWTVSSMRASAQLAQCIAKQIGPPASQECTAHLLRSLGVTVNHDAPQEGISEEEFMRVCRVLDWDTFSKTVPIELVKSLGFGWFVRTLWELADSIPGDTHLWGDLTKLLDRAIVGLTGVEEAHYYQAVARLTDAGLPWAANALTWPYLGE